MTAGPLSRFTVLDLTRVRAGPTCVRYFADWGVYARNYHRRVRK